jgi:hypothetical protein
MFRSRSLASVKVDGVVISAICASLSDSNTGPWHAESAPLKYEVATIAKTRKNIMTTGMTLSMGPTDCIIAVTTSFKPGNLLIVRKTRSTRRRRSVRSDLSAEMSFSAKVSHERPTRLASSAFQWSRR